ncbi:SDR family NAD(P)-dependent oxidoreductase [Actinomadura fibrosa]|uniref:SDR family NAD(P)-dependent oxidoreductase n=1 Tax=Actinomadura fibrosa TaxID=111802 RepID=A0ABW2XNN7_9ACTN|nr:SDR family oxidoreductase [Actinomadura fibrosa]
MSPLDGRTALVTGAGSGLGAVIARHLGRAGCRVVLVGRNAGRLAAVRDGLPDARSAICDVSVPAAVTALGTELADEQISILVNNAGVGGPVKPLVQIDPDEWDDVFAANVRSIHLMCRTFLPPMYERGDGDVVNVASVTGKRPLVRRTPYAASKMAVLGLTRTLAFEAGPQGVRVNSISPGPVRGERMERNFRLEAEASGGTAEEAERAFVSRAALDRLVEEDEVGAAVVAMLQIPGMCGADIDVSAGMIAP